MVVAMYNEVQAAEVTCGLRVSDVLTIRTRNSMYEFFVIDPVRAYGLLKGGVVGQCATEAFFCTPTTLDPGSKARLLIETRTGLRYITTSTIRSVKHLRSE
jgi:hypothetical protein